MLKGMGKVMASSGCTRPLSWQQSDSLPWRRVGKTLFGVEQKGAEFGAWVQFKKARLCAWSASQRISELSDISRKELYAAIPAPITRARERLGDVLNGQVYLDPLLRHVEDLHNSDWLLLGQDYAIVMMGTDLRDTLPQR